MLSFLSGTVPPCSFPFCPPHASSSYFSILLSSFLVLSGAMSVHADGFSVRTVHYRLVRVSFASFVFFPRLLFPRTSLFISSISDLSHSILSPSLRSRFCPSRVFFFFFSSSRPLSSRLWVTYTRSVVACFNTCFAQKFTSRFAISAPMFSQIAPSAVLLYSRSDFWIVA